MGDYGTDLACVSDFTDECGQVAGQRLLAEALVRRLSTPRGMVIDDPDYGTDLRQYLGLEYTARTAAKLVADARSECLKDERVFLCTPFVSDYSLATRTITLVVAVESSDDAFSLTMVVSAVSVELLTP